LVVIGVSLENKKVSKRLTELPSWWRNYSCLLQSMPCISFQLRCRVGIWSDHWWSYLFKCDTYFSDSS